MTLKLRPLGSRSVSVCVALLGMLVFILLYSDGRSVPADQSSDASRATDDERPPSVRIAGVVRDSSGEPVQNAIVEAWGPGRVARTARTSATGLYAFAELAPGRYEIAWKVDARSRGHREMTVVTIDDSGESVQVDFGPGERLGSYIRGTVLAQGAPVSAAEVLVSADDHEVSLLDRTNAAGGFEFAPVPAGTWNVVTRVSPSTVRETVEADGESEVCLDLALPDGRLAVTVLDAATLEPIEGIRVDAQSGSCFSSRTTDADGRVVFAELERGAAAAVRVSGSAGSSPAERSAYVSEDRDVIIPEASSTAATLEVRLSAGAALEGRVTGPNGETVVHPDVRLVAAEGGRRWRSTGDHAAGIEGRYRVEGIIPGEHLAIVRGWRAATTIVTGVRVAAPGPSRADFALPRGGVVVVRVVDRTGSPLANAAIECAAVMPGAEPIEVESAMTDGEGEAPPLRLAPGEYVFSTRASRGALPAISRVATVIEGETLRLTLTTR